MKDFNYMKAILVLGILVTIEQAVGQGTVRLTNMVPASWIDPTIAWCNFLAFCGSTVMTALAGTHMVVKQQ